MTGYPGIGDSSGEGEFIKRETILTGRSVAVSQGPTALDTPVQIEFGPAVNTVVDPVSLAADGSLTVNLAGTYYFVVTIAIGRTGASGVSHIYGRLLVNGAQPGGSVLTQVDDANAIYTQQYNIVEDFPAGAVITLEVLRDSIGNNSGGLVSGSPTLAGWNDTNTAVVDVYRLVETA